MTAEPWIWLFSDDDVMSIDCVAAARRTIEETAGKFDVYAFDLDLIDSATRLLLHTPPIPDVEPVIEFVINKMMGTRLSVMPDHIFSRRAYLHAGSFRPFPMAWASDDAAWVEFGGDAGIHRISHGRVAFRNGDVNISSMNGRKARPKLDAALAYSGWVRRRLSEGVLSDDSSARLTKAASRFVLGTVRWQGIPISVSDGFTLVGPIADNIGCSRARAMYLAGLMVVTPFPWRCLQALRRIRSKGQSTAPAAHWNWKHPPRPVPICGVVEQ